ncbi:uncharacterized protein JCM6883_006919 [Sporobolomyces salmoneus]|uniref:uncharacterized protein n=1 Tax=Sporobolomyces salmoneus TaxID=183962 RepID=UPI0031788540
MTQSQVAGSERYGQNLVNENGRGGGGAKANQMSTGLQGSKTTSSTSTQYGATATTTDIDHGVRRRSSIPNGVNCDNPLYSVPASRQKTPVVAVPTSNASGSSLNAPVPLLCDPFSRQPRPLSSVGPLFPFQHSNLLSTYEENETASGSTSESETPPPPISTSSSPVDQTGLMSMSAQDLRRPSFHNTLATTSKRKQSTTTTARILSFLRSLFSYRISRRMARILRMWFFAFVALFFVIKSLDFILPRPPISPAPIRASPPQPAIPNNDALQEQMRQVAESIPRPIPRVENSIPRLGSSGQVSFELEEEVKETKVTRDQAEQFRKRHLWRAPEEDAFVHFANPNKGQPHESTVIFLHGMRQKAADAFLPVNLHKDFTSTRWVLPQANNRTVLNSENGTELCPSWFDLSLPYDPTSANGRLPNLFASVRLLNQIIRAERALLILRRRETLANHRPVWVSEGPRAGLGYPASYGPDTEGRGMAPVPVEPGFLESFGTEEERRWASKRIVLAGFSQGAVVALMTALSGEYPLGGVAVFSGFLPMRWELPTLISDLETKDVPIFWGHGSLDEILTLDDAITSVNLMRHQSLVDFFSPLKNLPSNFTLPPTPAPTSRVGLSDVTFRVYPDMGHSWSHDEVGDLKRWAKAKKILPTGLERS